MSIIRHLRLPLLILALGISLGGIRVFAATPGGPSGDITLSSTVTPNCSIVVLTAAGATSLDLLANGTHVQVGTVEQYCNKRIGYYITVSSSNCVAGDGARIASTAAAPAEYVQYTVDFENPQDADPTGLLNTACGIPTTASADNTGLEVTNRKADGGSNDTSAIFINWTGVPTLEPDTYNDSLLVTIVVK